MKALKELNLQDLILFDIETVRLVEELEIDTPLFNSWAYKKKGDNLTDLELISSFKEEAALYPEFAKIVCISVGVIRNDALFIKSYNNKNEKILLYEFGKLLDSISSQRPKCRFLGFANKGFDEPFIIKRMIVNQVPLHDLLDTFGAKPWDLTSICLKEGWKGTSWNNASLLNIVTALGLDSPKEDIIGSQVGEVYYTEGSKGIERITKYCERDVKAVCDVLMKMRYEPLIEIKIAPEAPETTELPLLEKLMCGGAYGKKEKQELLDKLNKLNNSQKEIFFKILEAIPSGAKGKVTKFKKTHITELKKLTK
jgi:3'-5' exonuclease